MQRDFHYHVIFALAKEVGYEDTDANIIAYASQYVDDNTDRVYTASDENGEFFVGFPERIGKSGDLYFPIITQAVDMTAFKIKIQRHVYAPFHFVPGDNTVEIEGKKNPRFCQIVPHCSCGEIFLQKDAADQTEQSRNSVSKGFAAKTFRNGL